MSRLLTVLFISMFLGTAWASEDIQKDGQIPWPWGTEIAFPWTDIEGTWYAVGTDSVYETVFSFEVVYRSGGGKFLRIRELHPHTGKVVSSGKGVENAKIVSSLMSGSCYQQYRLSLRAYDEKLSSGERVTQMALSVGPAHSFTEWTYHFRLQKIADNPMGGNRYCE